MRLRLRVRRISEILREIRLLVEGSVLGLVLPRAVRGQRCAVAVGSDFLAQLEDRHADGDDKAEEGELKSVPSFQAEDTDRERDQRHRFEQDEHENRDDHLLQLGLAGLLDGATLAELHVESELIVLDVPRAHLHRRVHRQFEGHVVRGQVRLHVVQERALAAAGYLFHGVRVPGHLHRFGYLRLRLRVKGGNFENKEQVETEHERTKVA